MKILPLSSFFAIPDYNDYNNYETETDKPAREPGDWVYLPEINDDDADKIFDELTKSVYNEKGDVS